jgi:general secretion pathway protein D
MKQLSILLFMIIFLFANKCDTKLFSLSTSGDYGIKLQTVLSNLSDSCDLNIIVNDNLTKRKLKNFKLHFLKLKNLPLNDFLNHILGDVGFFYDLKDNTLTIKYVTTKNFKINYLNNVVTGSSSISSNSNDNTINSGSNDISSNFSFDFWSEFKTNLENFIKAQDNSDFKMPLSIIDKLTGIVTVTGTKQQLQKVANYINILNKRLHKEVFIDVKIYSVSLSMQNQTGIDWSNFGMHMDTGNIATAASHISTTILESPTFKLAGLLNFLSKFGQVNSISNPKITTLNNQKALITIGETVNYSYEQKTTDKNGNVIVTHTPGSAFVGVLLDILPQISDNNIIMMRINPSISSISKLNTNLPPNTLDKKLNTMVRVKDGDTIILGGLITDEKTLQANGVSVLKEIPLVKYLFSSKSKISDRKELIFVLTPHIIDLNKKQSVKKAGFNNLPDLGEL